MKNTILTILVFVFVIAGLSSCDDETSAGVTRITYYPTLEVLGDAVVFVNRGEAYVDAGYYAEMNGEEVTDQVVVTSDVNVNKSGLYTVSYKITNPDGFFVTGSRTVIVNNPDVTVDISGTYTLQSGSYRLNLSTGGKTAFAGYNITITYLSAGIFYVSDLFGGYYDQYKGYGTTYDMTGYIMLKADNSIELLSSYVNGWGDSLDALENGTYNSATGKIQWEATYVSSYTWFLYFSKQ